jgi:hypothetical protein
MKSLFLFCAVLFCGCSSLDSDFNNLMNLLQTQRLQALKLNQRITLQFVEKGVTVRGKTLRLSTLHRVCYNTSLCNDCIVFDGLGTWRYNKRIHGGEIELRENGVSRFIHVNCTGFAREGRYPDE